MPDALVPETLSASDRHFMATALRLGREMLGQVWPNPAVGCVIVLDGYIVGQGQTQPGGRPHAERVALDHAGPLARGATAYVTLEPCCHWGKTPPCADAMIRAGIQRIVIAVQDPDPRVDGGGIRRLRAAGIEVSLGLGAKAAALTQAGFFHRLRTGRARLLPSRAAPRWIDARISSRVGAPIGVLRRGQAMLPAFLQLTHIRGMTEPKPSTEEVDAQAIMLTLGQFGLANVALDPADPLTAVLAEACSLGAPISQPLSSRGR